MSFELPAIPSTDPNPSHPELLRRAYSRGEINYREYVTGQAVWVAQNADKYRLLSVPDPDVSLVEYVGARLDGRTDYNTAQAQAVGAWCTTVRACVSQNEASLSAMQWAEEACREAGLTSYAEILRASVSELSNGMSRWPGASFAIASRCMAKDSAARKNRGP